MKFKFDENLGRREIDKLCRLGHDAVGVRDQRLGGRPDPEISEACRREKRALVTLDRGFGNVVRFPPERFYGIVILEVPERASALAISERLDEFLAVLTDRVLGRELWIVEPGRVRIHQRETEPE